METRSICLAPNIDVLPESVRKVQKQLARLPLVPANGKVRKARDRLSKRLLELARSYDCVDAIDLLVGTY